MGLKPARLLLSAVVLVLWHLFLAWLGRQLLPGSATRLALLPYVGVSLVYLLGLGWVARHLSSESEGDEPNRWQALLAMLLAQVLLQGLDWLTISAPGEWSLTLLGLPLAGIGQLELIIEGLLPPALAMLFDRAVVVLVPLAIAYWAPEREHPQKRKARA